MYDFKEKDIRQWLVRTGSVSVTRGKRRERYRFIQEEFPLKNPGPAYEGLFGAMRQPDRAVVGRIDLIGFRGGREYAKSVFLWELKKGMAKPADVAQLFRYLKYLRRWRRHVTDAQLHLMPEDMRRIFDPKTRLMGVLMATEVPEEVWWSVPDAVAKDITLLQYEVKEKKLPRGIRGLRISSAGERLARQASSSFRKRSN